MSNYAIVPDSPVKPATKSEEVLQFRETAKKMRGLGIALILFGVAVLAAAAIGALVFHAHQGMVAPTYHYLILTLIASGGALLAFLAIFNGVKLQQRVYDKDPSYRAERLDEYRNHFNNKVHNPLCKLVETEARFPNHFDKIYPEHPNMYVQLSDINELLKQVKYAPSDDVSSFKKYIDEWNRNQAVNTYAVWEVPL